MQPQIERFQHPEKHGHGGHGGHDQHDEHGEDGEGSEEGGLNEGEESGEEKSEGQGKSGEEESKEVETNEGESEGSSIGGEEEDAPSTSEDEDSHEKEGGQDVEGVQFKGATSGGTREGEQGDTRKHIPDAKGYNKKRIESDYGRKQGEAQKPEQDPSDTDLVSIASCVALLRMAFLLKLGCRLLHPRLRET